LIDKLIFLTLIQPYLQLISVTAVLPWLPGRILHAPRHYFESAAIVCNYEQSFEQVGNFTILELVEAATFNVWNYNGSLTTPSCDESVIWMVSQAILPIDQSELNLLSRVRDDEGNSITRCNRPVQPLNGRRIVAIY
jgi:hypothetical protein